MPRLPFARRPLARSISSLIPVTAAIFCASVYAQETSTSNDTVVVTATALKVATPEVETPRAISTVSSEDLETRAVNTYDETFQYRSGVVSQPYGDDNNSDWFFLRGFSAENSTYQDGLRLFRTGGYFWWMSEPFGVERVDLLKGPASILYGEAPPGGVINAISKRPTREPQGTLEIEAGNQDHRQVAIDVSGPVAEREDMRYRMVGMYRDGEGELEGSEKERYYFAPSLAVDFSDDTTVTFLASVQRDKGVPTTGFFPAYGTLNNTPFGKINRDTNFGEPDYDTIDQQQASLGYEIEHRINDTWEFQQNFRYSHLDLDLRSVYAFPSNNSRTLGRGIVLRDGEYDAYTVDNRLIARQYGANFENTFLVGVDYQKLDLEYADGDSFSFSSIDSFDPSYGNYTPVSNASLTDHDVDKKQTGIYVQNQFRLNDRWIFLAGARHDAVKSSDETATARESVNDEQLSLSAGMMYLADNGLSPYVSYSESFTPLASSDASGNAYKPLEGRQVEAGLKITPLNFDGYLTVAAFDIEEDNTLISTGAPVQEQVGERRSQGMEVEGVGYLTDNLKLTASYTYTDTRYDASEAQQDKRAPFVPYHMASAWLDYDLASTAPGLSVGAGVRYMGETVPSADSGIGGEVPSATLYDAMASYDINDSWTAQLNVNNITDEEYVSGCDFYCYYGASRSVVGSLKYSW